MNKIIIPSIFVAVLLVGITFAMMPIEKASTVHTTIQASGAKLLTLTANPTPNTPATNAATWTISQAFRVVSVFATGSGDANLDAGVLDITTNLVGSGDFVEGFNPTQAQTAGGYNAVLREAQVTSLDIPSTICPESGATGIEAAGTTGQVTCDPAAFNIDIGGELVGTTTLTIATAGDAGDAGDVLALTVIIETRGDVTAPTAVLS